MRNTSSRTCFFPHSSVRFFPTFLLRVLRRDKVDTRKVGNVNRYVGIPVVNLGSLVGGFATSQLLKGSKEDPALRNFRQDSARELKGKERGRCVAILMGLVCLLSLRRTQRIRPINSTPLNYRVGRNVRRVSQANRGGTSITNALRCRQDYFRGMFQSLLRNSATRRYRGLLFKVIKA